MILISIIGHHSIDMCYLLTKLNAGNFLFKVSLNSLIATRKSGVAFVESDYYNNQSDLYIVLEFK